MTYSIHEGVQKLEQKIRAERIIAERFPDAILRTLAPGETPVWTSELLGSNATDFEIFGDNIRSYVAIEGMRVYQSPWRQTYVPELYEKLKREYPDAFKICLDLVVKNCT